MCSKLILNLLYITKKISSSSNINFQVSQIYFIYFHWFWNKNLYTSLTIDTKHKKQISLFISLIETSILKLV